MARRKDGPTLAGVQLTHRNETPMHRQLYFRLREHILRGALAGGSRLPASRTVAEELGVSRQTVLSAYEQLLAEGYIEARHGSGTYVTSDLPEDFIEAERRGFSPSTHARQVGIAERGRAFLQKLERLEKTAIPFTAFQPGPAADAFPAQLWLQLTSQVWRECAEEIVGKREIGGYPALRDAVAAYLRTARGVDCTSEQVIITAGGRQAIDLIARLLLNPGDTVWHEEPGYVTSRILLEASGAVIVPTPLDDEGLDLAEAKATGTTPRLICVTPSHQYPTGVTMSLTRRTALLEFASRNDAWVLEDDYDSEYRYASSPIASLQGLDHDGRVLYVGTFTKVLGPGIGIGYVVVPQDLINAFLAASFTLAVQPPLAEQAVLARFLSEGHFLRHLRRTRTLYRERRAAFIAAVATRLRGLLELTPGEGGTYALGLLPAGVDDMAVSREAQRRGIAVQPFRTSRMKDEGRGGLILGFAGVDEIEASQALDELGEVIRDLS